MDWKAEGTRLFSNRLKTKAGVSGYLFHDTRLIACLRARLRMDRSKLNESVWRRSGSAGPAGAAAHCSACALHENDTLSHILLHCPAFTRERAALSSALDEHHTPLTIATVLGTFPPATSGAARTSAYAASGTFLRAIHTARPL